mgnify:CR=1 FL=1
MITHRDRAIIVDLARRVADIASLPIMEERRQMWVRHNRLERVRPMILVFPEGSWRELLPESVLQCEGEEARRLRRRAHADRRRAVRPAGEHAPPVDGWCAADVDVGAVYPAERGLCERPSHRLDARAPIPRRPDAAAAGTPRSAAQQVHRDQAEHERHHRP